MVLTVSLLRTLTELSRDAACAARMASAGALDRLTPTFGRDFRDRRVFVGAELLWNVLEAISISDKSDETESVALPSEKFFAAFADALARATRDAHGDADKDLRNELFVAAHLLAERGGAWRARFRETRVIVDVAVAASTIPEWHDAHASKRVHPSACSSPARPRDFEMKRLAWTLVAELAADEAGAEETLGEDGGVFVAALLAHLAPLAGFPDHAGARGAAEAIERRWSDAQRADLQTPRCGAWRGSRQSPWTRPPPRARWRRRSPPPRTSGAGRTTRPTNAAPPRWRFRSAPRGAARRSPRASAARRRRRGGAASAGPGPRRVSTARGGGVGEGEGGGGSARRSETFFALSTLGRAGPCAAGARLPARRRFPEIRPRVADDPASLAACACWRRCATATPATSACAARGGRARAASRDAGPGRDGRGGAHRARRGDGARRRRCVAPDAKNRAVFVAEGGGRAAGRRVPVPRRVAPGDPLRARGHPGEPQDAPVLPRVEVHRAARRARARGRAGGHVVLNLWRARRAATAPSPPRLTDGRAGAPGALASLEDSV